MTWNDLTPSRRCEWIDLLRGWAVIVMIEVHVVNVYLHKGMTPEWLNYLNGLVAPSFILCAGYSLVLSTFRPDGSIRPFWPTAKRLGFILICAYALHAPGLTLAEWTVLIWPQRLRELFKIDVLQCIVFSLLILQGLARAIRKPGAYALAALALAIGAAWAAPHLWRHGVAEGLWLPIRGLINGNPDRGVTALFPLFPWFSFAAFGSVLGALYRHFRVMPREGLARWSESQWLSFLAGLGLVLLVWGSLYARTWLWSGTWPAEDAWRLHNTTLPSVAQRIGLVCLAGAFLGWVERVRPRFPGPNLVMAAGMESLLLYMLHLNLVFGLMLAAPIRHLTGWEWYALGWGGTLGLTVLVIGLSLLAAWGWQRVRRAGDLAWKIQRVGLWLLGIYFIAGGWMTYAYFRRSPEMAKEPYPFLNEARVRKGLPPTPDGLSHDPREVAREKARRGRKLSDEDKRLIESAP